MIVAHPICIIRGPSGNTLGYDKQHERDQLACASSRLLAARCFGGQRFLEAIYTARSRPQASLFLGLERGKLPVKKKRRQRQVPCCCVFEGRYHVILSELQRYSAANRRARAPNVIHYPGRERRGVFSTQQHGARDTRHTRLSVSAHSSNSRSIPGIHERSSTRIVV